jgi:hypothetical protein
VDHERQGSGQHLIEWKVDLGLAIRGVATGARVGDDADDLTRDGLEADDETAPDRAFAPEVPPGEGLVDDDDRRLPPSESSEGG